MRKVFSLLVLSWISLGLVACQKSANSPEAQKTVHLAIWSSYVTPEMLAEFTKATGYKVEMSNYSSNEELLAKLQAGASGVDVAVPSDYMVATMIELGMLRELKSEAIPHILELDPRLKGLYFDPKNAYSAPISWGTTGLAVNRNVFKGELKSWADLFTKAEYHGKFSLLDDVRETMGAALKSQGYSLNSTNEAEIAKAKEILMKARAQVRAFTSETLPGLVSGDLPIAHAYSVDGLQARARTNGAVEFIIPADGCTHWVDTLVIPAGAKNIDGAHALINFLLSAQIGAERTKNLWVAPANKKSVELLPEELTSNKMLFPSDADLAKCEMLRDIGESLVSLDRSWTEIRASR